MEINLKGIDLESVVAAAIVQKLDQESRDKMIESALKHLLTPVQSSYGRQELSPLTQAFNYAVEQQAKIQIKELMQNDETIKDAISSLVSEAFQKILSDDYRVRAVDRIAEAITKGLESS